MLTAEQRANRARGLGASDSPAILGVDRRGRSPADVYWSKITPPEERAVGTAADFGNFLERGLVDWAAAKVGVSCQTDVQVFSGEHPELLADYDGLAETCGIEAKTSSEPDLWGAEGTDEIPEDVIVQCQHQMAVLPRLVRVWVPVAVFGHHPERRLYCVSRDDDLIEMMVAELVEWWHRHVGLHAPPTGAPRVELLRRLRREAGKVVALDDAAGALVNDWLHARAERLRLEREEREAQRHIMTALGDAEGATLADGSTLSYRLQRGAPHLTDVAVLRARHPEIWDEFVRTPEFRVLRHTNRKED